MEPGAPEPGAVEPGTPEPDAAEPGAPEPNAMEHGAGDPAATTDGREDRGSRAIAVLLGLAAILTAIIGVRATALGSDASDAWQEALRIETKRAAGALVEIRWLYQTELTQATRVLEARELGDSFRAAAGEPGVASRALVLEADVQDRVLDALGSSSELATDPYYALPAGGIDLGRRLADLRGTSPDIVALDPDALQASGDALAARALRMTLVLVPVAVAALFGALAQPFARRRRVLLGLGALALGIAAVSAVGVELVG